MEIARGDLVLASGPGEYSNKPRPFLVVQSDMYNATHGSFTLCPLTSTLMGETQFRIVVHPGPGTGLTKVSEVEIDKIQTLRRQRIVRRFGTVPDERLVRIDDALRRWLSL